MKQRDQRFVLAALVVATAALVGLALAFAARAGKAPRSLDPSHALAGPVAPTQVAPPPEREPVPLDVAELPAASERTPDSRAPAAALDAPDGRGSLRGRVVLEDGQSPAAGARAVLSRGPAEPTAEEIVVALAAARPDRVAVSGADGSFEIAGLDPAQSYTLVIGAEGRVGEQPRWIVRPDRDPQTFALQRLFAARVHLSERGGGAVRLNAGLSGSRLGRSRMELPGVIPLYGAPASAVLAGISAQELSPERLGERLLLYKTSQPVDELEPIHFQANYPGYEQVDLDFAARFTPLGIPDYPLELAPIAAGFGAISIEVRGWNGACPAFQNLHGPEALLRLQSARGELMTFELHELDDQRTLVEGLPYGTWRVVVMLGSRLTSPTKRADEEHELTIGASPARYELDLSRSASLVFDVTDAQGKPVDGHVSFTYGLDDVDSRGWRTQHFLEPPYRLDELEPGTYRIVLMVPFPAGTSADRPLLAVARGGECTRVELRE